MKTNKLLNSVLVMGTLLYFPQASLSEEFNPVEIQSLRGILAPNEVSPTPTWKRLPPDHDPVVRNYVQQPPMIPHQIRGYKMTLRYNKCLSCHSWANYKKQKATKISLSHFKDRDGNDLANISAQRYFCNQCHAPQVDAKPLVENTFEAVSTLQQR